MIRIRQLTILTIGLLFYSCEGQKADTIDINQRANEFITEIDSEKLETLQHLHFIYRGQNGFWQNDSIDSAWYNLRISHAGDTIHLRVDRPEQFIKDFGINLTYDTSISKLGLIKVGNKVWLRKNWDNKPFKVLSTDSLSKKDPFKIMVDLNALKNKYELISIAHYNPLGQFVEFYFTTTDVLTYIPDSSKINSQFKSHWTKKWDKGQWISKNWNLRKLEKPMDAGG